MKTKPTITERRAAAMCATIAKAGSGTVEIEWKRSATWGLCPRIMFNGEKVAHASGCGYDKRSAVLAEALCHLGTTDEQRHRIASTSGCGESSTAAALAECGWTLECIHNGRTVEVYKLERRADA